MFPNLPVQHPRPDASRFINTLMGRTHETSVPLVEYLVDEVVMRPIMTGLLGRPWVAYGSDRASQKAYLDNFIDFWYRLGYDFVRFEQSLDLPDHKLETADTATGSTKLPRLGRRAPGRDRLLGRFRALSLAEGRGF